MGGVDPAGRVGDSAHTLAAIRRRWTPHPKEREQTINVKEVIVAR